MVGTPPLQPAPSLSTDTCVHAVTRPAVSESAPAFLGLMFGPRGQGGSEKTVVAAVDQVKDLKPSLLAALIAFIPQSHHATTTQLLSIPAPNT